MRPLGEFSHRVYGDDPSEACLQNRRVDPDGSFMQPSHRAATVVGTVSLASVPALKAYEDWRASAPGGNGKSLSPSQLRRVALMRRNGYTFEETGKALGRAYGVVRAAWEALPEELRPA